MQQVPQPPSISKSISLYSLVPFFSITRSGSTKWQANIVTYLLPQSFRITLKDTSFNISIDPIEFSSLHKFYRIFSQTFISHHDFEKYSYLWCSDNWKMDLQVEKLKVDIFTTSRQNSHRSLSLPTWQRQITHSPQVTRTMKTYFTMCCFKSTFLKYVTKECTFC